MIVDNSISIQVALPTSSAQSASNVAATLNANATFKIYAEASVSDSRLVLKSKNKGGSIQYDNVNGKERGHLRIRGIDDLERHDRVPWPGWRYTAPADTVSYGIKNDGSVDNDAWSMGTSNPIEIDAPRAFQMLRTSLVNSSILWTTMTGYSYYYMGIGNEIGYDAANFFDKSIPVSRKPYDGTSGTWQEQTIIDANGGTCTFGCGVKYIRQQSTETGWWGLSWLGELYPDSQYAADSNWKDNGNLRTGVGATYYVRDQRDVMPSTFAGTKLTRAERRTGPRGGTTLFWGETTTSAFHHTSVADTDTASILADGIDIREHYALPVPDTVPKQPALEHQCERHRRQSGELPGRSVPCSP